MTPPSIQKFDLEDTGKLVAIVATSEMTREYLIKQKILPDHINNKKRSHTQLDSRKQVIAFQDRVITINIKEAQHPLK